MHRRASDAESPPRSTHWIGQDDRLYHDAFTALGGEFEQELSRTYPLIGWGERARVPVFSHHSWTVDYFWEICRDTYQLQGAFLHMLQHLTRQIQICFPPDEFPIMYYRTPAGTAMEGSMFFRRHQLQDLHGLERFQGAIIVPPLRIGRWDEPPLGDIHFFVMTYAKGETA